MNPTDTWHWELNHKWLKAILVYYYRILNVRDCNMQQLRRLLYVPGKGLLWFVRSDHTAQLLQVFGKA